ncbi:uncharacterized protein MYCFIDRAFT_175412 [Pseudocercospora fijiensis CIRAD86]|uniref:Uncharacterized protein n=1 Tax=Pseudocercospora fijiensis (strain CIRAD86) TaxID=383855 RepID=M2ZS10_PSEFD|nr:uncharacterized protein MYCFIDRAFT_175412 [Pseudocercospora fijiensis CIRAD86]EME81824.1 hypothetical protein MYCFIDRAFT_175412 [Pseudocercospora fijiensis CIRAD86]
MQLDLAARSIDLVSTIAKISSPGAVEKVSARTSWRLHWSLQRMVSFPNDNGSRMLDDTLTMKANNMYSLQVVVPLSIGRSLLADDTLCWLATTHAVLFRYHDLDASTEILCHLILAAALFHLTSASQLILQDCLLVTTQRCMTDALDWIYNHWQGELVVTSLAGGKNRLVFLVSKRCESGEDCTSRDHYGPSLATPKAEPPFSEGSSGFLREQQREGYRTALYDLPFKFSKMKNAQEIVRSIMATKVEPSMEESEVVLNCRDASLNQELMWWMARSPGILQANYGEPAFPPGPRPLFESRDDDDDALDVGMRIPTPSSDVSDTVADLSGLQLGPNWLNADSREALRRTANMPCSDYGYSELQKDYHELLDHCGCRQGRRPRAQTEPSNWRDRAIERDNDACYNMRNNGCVRALAVFPTILLVGHALIDAPSWQLKEIVSKADVQSDMLEMEAFTSIIASNGILHRTMTLVSTPPSLLRIVDSSDMYKGYMLAMRPRCNHPRGQLPARVSLRNSDEVLRQWSSDCLCSLERDAADLYLPGPSVLKLNIAVALSVRCMNPAVFCSAHDRRKSMVCDAYLKQRLVSYTYLAEKYISSCREISDSCVAHTHMDILSPDPQLRMASASGIIASRLGALNHPMSPNTMREISSMRLECSGCHQATHALDAFILLECAGSKASERVEAECKGRDELKKKWRIRSRRRMTVHRMPAYIRLLGLCTQGWLGQWEAVKTRAGCERGVFLSSPRKGFQPEKRK